jgi:hypothetical protein
MEGVDLRHAHPADSGRIAALHAASWRCAYRGILPDAYLDGGAFEERRRHWERRLAAADAGRRAVILGEREGELVGFVCVLLDEDPGWGACLDNLHVRPDLRGRGLGDRLFAAAAAWVRVMAPGEPLHLWVFKANAAARRFYDCRGGRLAGEALQRLPGGVRVASLRYIWKDLERLGAPPAGDLLATSP